MHGNDCYVKLEHSAVERCGSSLPAVGWLRMRRLALIVALGLAGAGTASAELAVPGVQNGMLAVSPGGTPLIAYLNGGSLEIAARSSGAGWRPVRAASVAPGSSLAAFAAGRRGPVAVIAGPGSRSLVVVRRGKGGWRTTPLAAVPAGVQF